MSVWHKWLTMSPLRGQDALAGVAHEARELGFATVQSALHTSEGVMVRYCLDRDAVERVMGAYFEAKAMATHHANSTGRDPHAHWAPLDESRFVDCMEIVAAHRNGALDVMWATSIMRLLGDAVRAAIEAEWRKRRQERGEP